jgi:homoserine kinase type II
MSAASDRGFLAPVLDGFDLPPTLDIHPLGNAGGFSGSLWWRLRAPAASPPLDLGLRRFPEGGTTRAALRAIHALMRRARAAGLDCIPRVWQAHRGESVVEWSGTCWEALEWMPGTADYEHRPSTARLEEAARTLATLHRVWAEPPLPPAPCPAVARRLRVLAAWQTDQASTPPRVGRHPPNATLEPLLRRGEAVLHRLAPSMIAALLPWLQRPVAIQPCLCDVWHDHLLFQGDRLTGLLDFASVQPDHVAVDLARLTGSLVEDDPARRAAFLDAYARLRPLGPADEALVALLDRAGLVASIANWLGRLDLQARPCADLARITRRLARLVARAERLNGQNTMPPLSC